MSQSRNGNGNGSGSGSGTNRGVVTSAIHGAVAGGLAQGAADLLVANLDETVLMGCIGAPADALSTTEATLVCVVLDMSSSMSSYEKAVVDAYDAMLGALAGSKAAASILLSAWTFADAPSLLHGYVPVAKAPPLGASYAPNGCTALYDALLGCMTGLVAYGEQLLDNGVPNRRILFVLSDGEDNASKARSGDVKRVADALLVQEVYTLAYAGFGSPDLAKLAADVGFPAVVTAKATPAEIRRIFKQVSTSVIRVSQAAAATGGFF